jgi:uncharacterized protein YjbI with pentapeptide repeats
MDMRVISKEEIITALANDKFLGFRDTIFRHMDLSDISFEDVSFSNCRFEYCTMKDTNFRRSTLNDITFTLCDMNDTVFDWSHAHRFSFDKCNINHCYFPYSVFKHGGFFDCQLISCDVTNIYQVDVSYTRGICINMTYEYSILIDVTYFNTVLRHVSYECVEGAHVVFAEVILQETELDPLGEDNFIVYGGFDPVQEKVKKEFAVHLLVDTDGNATVTSVEEV